MAGQRNRTGRAAGRGTGGGSGPRAAAHAGPVRDSPAAAAGGVAAREPGRRRRDPWKLAFVVLLALVALGVVGWEVLGPRLLVVREVRVEGARTVSRERVLSAAQVPVGTPLARVDLRAARRRVESIREVESARVVRIWPASLRIAVRERTPIAITTYQGQNLHVDRYGFTVPASAQPPARLPRLVVATPGENDPATRAAVAVLNALTPDVVGRVAAVEAPSAESVTLRLSSGPAVVWGAPERAQEKLRALRVLLWSPKYARAKEIDISSPEVVSTR